MALTRDLVTTFPEGSNRSYKGQGRNFVASYEIDFAGDDMSLAQNEIMRITTIPAGTAITAVAIYVNTAQATITDIDIGTGDTTTSANLIDGATLASGSVYIGGTVDISATGGGLINATATNLLLTNKDAQTLNSAKVTVICNFVDFSGAIS